MTTKSDYMNLEDQYDYAEGPVYAEPQGSVWVIGVNYNGDLFVIDFPNLWQCEDGGDAEHMGLPPDTVDVGPGVYRVTMDYSENTVYSEYDGTEDYDWEFNPVKWEPLWVPEDNEADASQ